MKTAYLDCSSGAAGDMLLAAALDAAPDSTLQSWREIIQPFADLEKNTRIEFREVTRAGVPAKKIDFHVGDTHADHHSYHAHRKLSDVLAMFEDRVVNGNYPESAYRLSKRIFSILAEGEAEAHDSTPDKVHFHEVGALDSILDIAGFSLAFLTLEVTHVIATPVTLGSGTVNSAHGILTVPPPAVAAIIKNHKIPTSDIKLPGECLTPTGAAILAAIVNEWGEFPKFLKIEAEGVGAGTRDDPDNANVVRLQIG